MPRKEKIRNMFDSIAPEYDKLNHLMSLDIDRSWRKRALKRIFSPSEAEKGVDPDCSHLQVLDIACGTGDFSVAIAREMLKRGGKGSGTPGGHITGLDLSEGMLKIMREKIQAEGYDGFVSYETGDCEALRFGDGTFDRVTVAFGVRNFENREQGLREMLRVLKPGGKLVILELSVPSNVVIRWCFNLYFLHVLPLIGGRISGDKAAYRYLPASVLNFPGKKAFMQTLRECGYCNVSHKAFTLGVCRMYTAEKSASGSRE